MTSVACAEHDFQPVNFMRAVYRCRVCGGFAYKGRARNGVGECVMKMYRCHVADCKDRVVVMFPVVRGIRRHQPSCEAHRRDKIKGEAGAPTYASN